MTRCVQTIVAIALPLRDLPRITFTTFAQFHDLGPYDTILVFLAGALPQGGGFVHQSVWFTHVLHA